MVAIVASLSLGCSLPTKVTIVTNETYAHLATKATKVAIATTATIPQSKIHNRPCSAPPLNCMAVSEYHFKPCPSFRLRRKHHG
jgi:hypothetical protein